MDHDHDALRALAHANPGICIYPEMLRPQPGPWRSRTFQRAAKQLGYDLPEWQRAVIQRVMQDARPGARLTGPPPAPKPADDEQPTVPPAVVAAARPAAPDPDVAPPPVTRWRWWHRWGGR
ncbi:hypothetical protein [Micromonospora zhanjiangensis]|uniref:Uncharacterized protein n=1 Tax=Micromonospora zhanjiangensis TaxID=1522057 RepID=A0ABV8KNT8_9ACTN